MHFRTKTLRTQFVLNLKGKDKYYNASLVIPIILLYFLEYDFSFRNGHVGFLFFFLLLSLLFVFVFMKEKLLINRLLTIFMAYDYSTACKKQQQNIFFTRYFPYFKFYFKQYFCILFQI